MSSMPTPIDWHGNAQPGNVVVLNNPYGNVRVRSSAYGDLALRAVVQNRDVAIGQPRLVDRYADGRIEMWLEAEGLDASVDRTRFRADFTLNFPSELGLEVRLAEGDFQMHASEAPVTVRARKGTIRLQTTGAVDVEVLTGAVEYRPAKRYGPPAGGRIQTSEAPVNLILPDYEQLALRMISGVAITSDAPELLQSRRTEGREVVMRMSEDVPEMFVQTDSGPIRIVTAGSM